MPSLMASMRRLAQMREGHGYRPVDAGEFETKRPRFSAHRQTRWSCANIPRAFMIFIIVAVMICATLFRSKSGGGQCFQKYSRSWGQYSPYFPVHSSYKSTVPSHCELTFVQALYRHGARDPTAGKSVAYRDTMSRIKKDVDPQHLKKAYSFLQTYEYMLGADQLTDFGRQQLLDAGLDFYGRYRNLAKFIDPFIRASGQKRVVESAQKWTQGFHLARLDDKFAKQPDKYPYKMVVISEDEGFNNTLSHDLCPAFRSGIGYRAMTAWANIFIPPIKERLNKDLPGANLSLAETIHIMDLCPFETLTRIDIKISPFCFLFGADEWLQYDYFQTLGKWYGFGTGNPFGPTQGAGFVNEVISRMTKQPVHDHTSTNHTLDSNPSTFPIGGEHVVFADFSHDNDISAILSAFGLYDETVPLSNTSIISPEISHYSASWTVPFASRAYFEKMKCRGEDEEWVRVLINDRVVPLDQAANCKDNLSLGRCKLSEFTARLSSVSHGARWNQC